MIFLIGLLTVVLVLTCLLLILLVLIQLPKKEAGAGIAFGGAATDALFGAGTGNVLTKTTKFATVAFFVLLLLIGGMQNSVFKKDPTRFKKAVEQQSKEGLTPAPVAPATTASTAPDGTGLTNFQILSLTNTAAGAATSAPAPAK
jgi:preprotein translocase subunit SecG